MRSSILRQFNLPPRRPLPQSPANILSFQPSRVFARTGTISTMLIAPSQFARSFSSESAAAASPAR